MDYESTERFLREYSTKTGPYDFNGLLHLLLAAVDNLRVHAADADFSDFAEGVSKEQVEFLRWLVDACTVPAADAGA